jgi:hypothetical protein
MIDPFDSEMMREAIEQARKSTSVIDRHRQQSLLVKKSGTSDLIRQLPTDYPFITMARIPKGLEVLDHVSFEVIE